jgi:uncharacterized RDD family membrane protein YckC
VYCSRCGTWAPDDETLCGLCGAALQLENTPRPAPLALPPPVYAGFWRRLWAAALDITLLMPFSGAVQVMFGRSWFDPGEIDADYWRLQLVLTLIGWLYGALMESSRWQGTLGQQVLGIQVTDLNGRRISFLRATGRHFAQILSFLLLGIGFLMIAFTVHKQALHDKLAGCLLTRSEEATRPVVPRGAPA